MAKHRLLHSPHGGASSDENEGGLNDMDLDVG
jgi:hypothetical protein